MGKGDKKSKRGKIVIGSYGVKRRSKNADKGLNARLGIAAPPRVKSKPAATKTAKETEAATIPAVEKKPAAAKKPAVEKKPAAAKKTATAKKPAAEKKTNSAD